MKLKRSSSAVLKTLLALVCWCCAASAQTYRPTPGFDPRPVTIQEVPLGPQRPITFKDLVEMRDFKGSQISPDGKSVAYVLSQPVLETNSYRTGIFVMETRPGSTPVSLGSAGPPQWDDIGQQLEFRPQWSPDSEYFTFLIQKGATRQIWRWKRAGGKPQQLTRNANDVQSYQWSPDGSKIFFTTHEESDPVQATSLAEQGVVWDGSIRAHKALPLLQAVAIGKPAKTRIWVYDFAENRERKASSDEEKIFSDLQKSPIDDPKAFMAKASLNGAAVAYLIRLQERERFLYHGWAFLLKDQDGKTTPLIPSSTLYIQDFWWSNDASRIYLLRQTEDGRSTLFELRVDNQELREITRTGDQLHTCSLDKAQARAVCVHEKATMPPELVRVNLRTGELQPLVQINPEFHNIKLSPATRLEWKNKYGDPAFGHLVKPLNYEPGKRYPLIVTTYRSFGFLRGAAGDEYPIQVFAANGFAVLSFDRPPTRPPDPNDVKSNLLDWYSPLASLEVVIKTLIDMGIVDPDRKGICGLSNGAEITEFSISHSDLFQAAATSGGSARDPLFYYLAFDRWKQRFKEMLGGGPDGPAAAAWKDLSPALNAHRIKAPLLTQAADTEYLVSLQLFSVLKEQGKPMELVVYPGEAHVKNQPRHRYTIYRRNVDWFNFWLQEKEDPDPSKTEQYRRWRAMRERKESATTASAPAQ